MDGNNSIKTEQEKDVPRLSDKAQCQNDAEYKKGCMIYRIGFIALFVLTVLILSANFLHIQITAGNIPINNFLYLVCILPVIPIFFGLEKSRKVCKKYGNYGLKSHTICLILFFVLTVLIAVFGIYGIVRNPYANAETSEITVRDEEFTAVQINLADGTLNLGSGEVPDSYVVEVYKNYGIFRKRLAVSEPSNTRYQYTVKEGADDDSFILVVKQGSRGAITDFKC